MAPYSQSDVHRVEFEIENLFHNSSKNFKDTRSWVNFDIFGIFWHQHINTNIEIKLHFMIKRTTLLT